MHEISKCPKCGRAKNQVSSGSLTQWIASCACSLKTEESNLFRSLKICKKCGKRVGTLRTGSFTQWIFRQDFCSCEYSELIGKNVTAGKKITPIEEALPPQEIETIDVPGFPTERYLPVKRLGGGENSNVYLAKDTLLDKLVAVKMLQALSSSQLISFQKEAKATSALEHKNIVRIMDFGVSANEIPYMVLEYVNGSGLDQYLKEHGAMDWRMTLAIICQISNALALAHRKEIFHRDIKPGNILLEFEDSGKFTARLIDFGIAGSSDHAKASSLPSGTPAYLSPEQARGLIINSSSEVFSLGCVLYECLTGKQLFESSDSVSLVVERFRNYSNTNVDLDIVDAPQNIKDLLRKSIAENPEERFSTVEELEAEIESVIQKEADIASSESPPDLIDEEPIAKGHDALSIATTNKNKIFLVSLAVLTLCVVGLNLIPKRTEVKKASSKISSKEDSSIKSAYKAMQDFKVDPSTNEEIDLSGRKTTDANLVDLELLPVRVLKLSNTSITDEGLRTLGKIKSLESLKLVKSTLITAKGIEHLTGLTKLRFLDVTSTRLGDEVLPVVAKFKSLEKLSMKYLHLTEKALLPLKNHPSLIDIDVNRSKIKDGISVLKSIKTLECIRVGDNGVTDSGVKAISGLPNLWMLHIQLNPITGKSLKEIASWSQLKDLWLIETKVKPDELRLLNKLRQLEILRVDGLHIDDSTISNLVNLNSIKNLTIRDNPISDSGLIKLAKMKNLKSLDITGCQKVTLAGIGRLIRKRPDITVKTSINGRVMEFDKRHIKR